MTILQYSHIPLHTNMTRLAHLDWLAPDTRGQTAVVEERGLGVDKSCQFRYIAFLYSTVQCSTVQFSSVQFSSVQFSSVQFSSVQFSSVQFSSVQFSSVQYSTKQHLVQDPPLEGIGVENSCSSMDFFLNYHSNFGSQRSTHNSSCQELGGGPSGYQHCAPPPPPPPPKKKPTHNIPPSPQHHPFPPQHLTLTTTLPLHTPTISHPHHNNSPTPGLKLACVRSIWGIELRQEMFL